MFKWTVLFLLEAMTLTMLLTLAYIVIRTCIGIVIGSVMDCITRQAEKHKK